HSSAVGRHRDLVPWYSAIHLKKQQGTRSRERISFPYGLRPVRKIEWLFPDVGVGPVGTNGHICAHFVRAAHAWHAIPTVQIPIPVAQPQRVEVIAVR